MDEFLGPLTGNYLSFNQIIKSMLIPSPQLVKSVFDSTLTSISYFYNSFSRMIM